MKKIFKPLGPDVVEKQFIGDAEPIPDGWHSAAKDAMRAWNAPTPEAAPNEAEEPRRKPGRPPKQQ